MLSFRYAQRGILATALGALALALAAAGAAAYTSDVALEGNPEAGKAIAMDRSKGNCIACHLIPGGDSPGAIGPALIAMQSRYPDKNALAAQIWDATVKNPEAVMPPFGKHQILTDQEFADVVAYVWTL